MLLIKKTVEKYGYNPTELSKSSHKVVIFDCIRCHKEVELRIRYYSENYACNDCRKEITKEKNYKPKKLGLIKYDAPEFVLRQETYNKFGYYPEELSFGSDKKILWKCSLCMKDVIYESCARSIDKSTICISCVGRKHILKHNQTNREQGLAPSGKKLGEDMDNRRYKAKLWRRKWRATPVGQMINRLRVSLKRIQKGYTTKNLPYSVEEFVEHMQSKMELRENKCPICGIDFNLTGYDIEHKIPLSTANLPEEVLELFALENLDVMCPDCNQRIKRSQIWEY
jgi:hypothetical protein